MKNFYIALTLILLTYANYLKADDQLFLKNGVVVSGQVVELTEGKQLTFKTSKGDVLTYPMIEVQRIAYGESDVTLPSKENTNKYVDYSQLDKGFFIVPEFQTACSIYANKKNMLGLELDVTGGYRFNEYVRVGLGLGVRYYINDELRCTSNSWAMPIFVNVRGNIISMEHRHIVPYYSFDIGAAIGDGFFFRPTIGVRFGEPRSAFLLGVTYWCQNLKTVGVTSFFGLKLGYEF